MNGGTCQAPSLDCICPPGYSGAKCEKYIACEPYKESACKLAGQQFEKPRGFSKGSWSTKGCYAYTTESGIYQTKVYFSTGAKDEKEEIDPPKRFGQYRPEGLDCHTKCSSDSDCNNYYPFCQDGICKGNCTDGVKNNGETSIDCGGPCAACGLWTCDDGVQNQGELAIDCGGPCPFGPNCRRCLPNFVDKDGENCQKYAAEKYCTKEGEYGENWNVEGAGPFSDYGVNGDDAFSCPQCGCKCGVNAQC